MNEVDFLDLMEEYSRFRSTFKIQINNSSISSGKDDCYIIDEYWNVNLINCFQQYNKSRSIILPGKNPNFINDIPTLIDCIKKKKKFKLISKDLIFLINKNKLKMDSLVNYYCGNRKLIIEYKYKNDDSILIINPLEYQSENNIFFISTKSRKKILLYKYILIKSNNIEEINAELNSNVFIYSFNEYIQNINSNYSNFNRKNIRQIDNFESFKQDLLKIFIYIYYFELDLLESKRKEDIIDEDNKYYIINPEWIEQFKKYYNYSSLYNLLKINNEKDKKKYNNLNNSID